MSDLPISGLQPVRRSLPATPASTPATNAISHAKDQFQGGTPDSDTGDRNPVPHILQALGSAPVSQTESAAHTNNVNPALVPSGPPPAQVVAATVSSAQSQGTGGKNFGQGGGGNFGGQSRLAFQGGVSLSGSLGGQSITPYNPG